MRLTDNVDSPEDEIRVERADVEQSSMGEVDLFNGRSNK